jgi:hypothetical protein
LTGIKACDTRPGRSAHTFINHGSILWSNFPEDVDGPGLVVYTGHVVIELSPDGFATSVSRVLHHRDICAAFA